MRAVRQGSYTHGRCCPYGGPGNRGAKKLANRTSGNVGSILVQAYRELQPIIEGRPLHLSNEYIDRQEHLSYQPLPGAQLRHFARGYQGQ